ncbi:MAG TPA: hypothetical protein VM889_05090 [Candidatus Thermoplasmatota archaeon]|nr:hypothetical protein [Candidatus Thermoplasmatota archaeon]
MAEPRSPRGQKLNLGVASTTLSTVAPPSMAPAPAAAQQGRPTGVTILGVLEFIAGGFAILIGLGMFAGGAIFGSLMASSGAEAGGAVGGMFAALFGILGFILLGLGALYIALGAGTMGGKPWAWTATIVLQWIGAVFAVLSLVAGDMSAVLSLAIAGLILWYYYEPGPKAWFGKSDKTAPWASLVGNK